MDAIYSAYNVNASAKINIGEYFLKYKQLIDSMKIDFESELNEEQIEQISRDCSINNLIVEDYYIPTPHQIPKKKSMPKIETDLNLQTLLKLKNIYSNKPKVYRPSLKYRNEITVNYSQPIETGMHIVPDKDILVYIRVYHPFSCRNSEQLKKRAIISLNHVIAILGQQTLAQLRDKIDCNSDLSCTIESSENPTEFYGENNRETYKSSFFYIEDTFYNDTRYEDCRDNSEPIIKWAKTRKLGPFNVQSMEKVRIDSLCVRFGYPWVFQHQGNCEHLITFSDARLMDADDHLAIANYPRISRVRPLKHAYCLMCIERPVHWVVLNNDRLPHDPCHFCHQCFIRYNYIDGKKVGNFRAYRYPRDNELLRRIIEKKATLQDM